MGLLRGEPGETDRVSGPQHDPEVVEAEADAYGVLRNGLGQSFSSGSYEVVDDA